LSKRLSQPRLPGFKTDAKITKSAKKCINIGAERHSQAIKAGKLSTNALEWSKRKEEIT
jgi:hypothetical protein